MDFTLAGWQPADEQTRHYQDTLILDAGRHDPLVHQETGDEDFVLLAEPCPTAGPYYQQQRTLAVHVVRHPVSRLFSIDWHSAPTTALTVAWLLERGADEDLFRAPAGPEDAPADVTSAQIEDRVRRSGSRYTVVESDDGDPVRSWVLLRDREPAASALPFLLQVRTELARGGFRLREGSFPDPQSAQQWLEEPNRPLPPPVLPDPVVAAQPLSRTEAARGPVPAGIGRSTPEHGIAVPSSGAQPPVPRPRRPR